MHQLYTQNIHPHWVYYVDFSANMSAQIYGQGCVVNKCTGIYLYLEFTTDATQRWAASAAKTPIIHQSPVVSNV